MITKTFADFRKDSTGQYKKVGYNTFAALAPTDNYIWFYKNGLLKKVKILESDDYIYKFNKRSISAIGGAAGLYEFLKRENRYETGGFFHTVSNGVFDRLGGDVL